MPLISAKYRTKRRSRRMHLDGLPGIFVRNWVMWVFTPSSSIRLSFMVNRGVTSEWKRSSSLFPQ